VNRLILVLEATLASIYVGWPADFYAAHVRLVGTHIRKASFGAIIAPFAAKLVQHEDTINCTGP
jgi:hypothetical protein